MSDGGGFGGGDASGIAVSDAMAEGNIEAGVDASEIGSEPGEPGVDAAEDGLESGSALDLAPDVDADISYTDLNEASEIALADVEGDEADLVADIEGKEEIDAADLDIDEVDLGSEIEGIEETEASDLGVYEPDLDVDFENVPELEASDLESDESDVDIDDTSADADSEDTTEQNAADVELNELDIADVDLTESDEEDIVETEDIEAAGEDVDLDAEVELEIEKADQAGNILQEDAPTEEETVEEELVSLPKITTEADSLNSVTTIEENGNEVGVEIDEAPEASGADETTEADDYVTEKQSTETLDAMGVNQKENTDGKVFEAGSGDGDDNGSGDDNGNNNTSPDDSSQPSADGMPPHDDKETNHDSSVLVPPNMGKDNRGPGLAAHEGENLGHTLREHVGRTDEELANRLVEDEGIKAASTFTDRETAEQVVAETLKDPVNQAKIQKWIDEGQPTPTLALFFNGDPSRPIGRGILRNGSLHPMYDARIVLKAEKNGNWLILTGYPEIRSVRRGEFK
jgi:hypothetical protein